MTTRGSPDAKRISPVATRVIADRVSKARPRVLAELASICEARGGGLTAAQVAAVGAVLSYEVHADELPAVLSEWLIIHGGDPGDGLDWATSPAGTACLAASQADGPMRRDPTASALHRLFAITEAEETTLGLTQLVSERARSRARRRAEGVGRRKAASKEAKPWTLAGVSRATWYRQQAAIRVDETPRDPTYMNSVPDEEEALDEDSFFYTRSRAVSPGPSSPKVGKLPTAEGRRYAAMALAVGEQWSDDFQMDRPGTWFAPSNPVTRVALEDDLQAAITAGERREKVGRARERRNPTPRTTHNPDPQQRPAKVSEAAWATVPEDLRALAGKLAGRFLIGGLEPDDAMVLAGIAARRVRSRAAAIAAACPAAAPDAVHQVARDLWQQPLTQAVRDGSARVTAMMAEALARRPTPEIMASATALADRLADPPYPETYRRFAIRALAETMCDPAWRGQSPRTMVNHAREVGYQELIRRLKAAEKLRRLEAGEEDST